MSDLLVSVVSFLLATVFAAVWGAHVFETAVLFRVWAADPPKALPAFVATPYSMRGAGFWRALAPCLYVMATIAVIVALVAGLRMHLAMAAAGACGLIHMAMIFAIFLPTNVKLGFYSGEPANLDPQVLTTLVRRWGGWNFARLGVETAGFAAALLALKAS
ncbi:MAG TPA: hypothetical protein VN805_04030 [Caulobacteraceae bacterium]|nr:hypothetical protein [Caulobacteraceae bacterium]